ncbi:hypothetical protein HPB52_017652 [Rhipicephalus sanguineus]|uniref:Uncharacterized protein n=1 Tax=Rhipicephalus sanguineus TaxID=34632 RepID=A0A9D4SRR0_RHISA|nr:hypothetical protein HPB52_017652 [Rhipicephalus sanguineus]
MAFHVTTRVPFHPFCLVLLLSLLIGTAVAGRIRRVDSDFHEPEPPPTFTEDEPPPKEAVTPQQTDVDREIPVYDVGIRQGTGDEPPAYDVGVPDLARPPRPADEEPTSMAKDSQPPDDGDDVPVADADAVPSMCQAQRISKHF